MALHKDTAKQTNQVRRLPAEKLQPHNCKLNGREENLHLQTENCGPAPAPGRFGMLAASQCLTSIAFP